MVLKVARSPIIVRLGDRVAVPVHQCPNGEMKPASAVHVTPESRLHRRNELVNRTVKMLGIRQRRTLEAFGLIHSACDQHLTNTVNVHLL